MDVMRVVRKNKRFVSAIDAIEAGMDYITDWSENYSVENYSNGISFYFYVDIICRRTGKVKKTLKNWRVEAQNRNVGENVGKF